MGKKVMTPFKMSPKQAGMIESIRKENPKAAKKIEAGIKDGDKKNKEDVPGPALMDQKYAATMGGYKAPLKKAALYSKNPHTIGTPSYAEWEKKNNSNAPSGSFGVDGERISEEKMKEYGAKREKSMKRQAHEKRYSKGTGSYAGTYVDKRTGKRTRGSVPKFEG